MNKYSKEDENGEEIGRCEGRRATKMRRKEEGQGR